MVSLQPVTDPLLLKQLNGGAAAPGPVTDPAIIAQLNADAKPATAASSYIPLGVSAIDKPMQAIHDFHDQMIRATTMGLSDKAAGLAHAIPGLFKDGPSFSDLYHEGLQASRMAGEQYAKDHPIGSKVATTLGAATSGAPTSGSITLGNMIKGGAGTGAIAGFGASDDKSLVSDLLSTASGSAIGAATSGALGLASRALAPQTSSDVTAFMQSGGKPTLGQLTGHTELENAAAKMPFMHGAVDAAKERSLQSANKVLVNDAIAPIGETLSSGVKAGQPAIAEAAQKVKDAYAAVATAADPAAAKAAANTAYARLLRVKGAAESAAAVRNEGVFTPGQFLGAVKNLAANGKAAEGAAVSQQTGNWINRVLGPEAAGGRSFWEASHPGWSIATAPVGLLGSLMYRGATPIAQYLANPGRRLADPLTAQFLNRAAPLIAAHEAQTRVPTLIDQNMWGQ